MNFFKDILPLLFALAAIVLVMYLSFVFTKYIGKRINSNTKTKNIKIIEQLALGQDKSLIISEICGKYYLIGASQNIEILKELEDVNTESEETIKNDFMTILNKAIKSKKSEGNQNDEKK